MKTKITNNKIFELLIIIIITIIACAPLFVSGIEGHFGQDLGFHLNRIEGLAVELKAGHFPVKIESNWMNGYGYPVSIYYGDLLLYIPAIFRLIGIGVVRSYKLFIFLITFGTAFFSHICFKKIICKTDISLVCALVYTCASYRIENVFIRAAVGEYSAMMFFPIILLAFYLIYSADKNIGVEKMFLNSSLLCLSITGLINTHMLSTIIVGVALIVFCLVMYKKTFTKSVLITYVMAGIEIVVVNLFYLIPFVDYFFNVDVNINNTVGNARQIQDSGMRWYEYVSFFKMPFANVEGFDDRLLVTPGIVIIFAFFAGIVMWIRKKASKEMKGLVIAIGTLLFLASCYFPWNFFASYFKLGDFLAQVQFPWRYVGLVLILGTLLLGRILERVNKRVLFYGGIILVTIITLSWFTYEYNKYGELETYKESNELDSFDMGFIEYLRVGTSREKFTGKIVMSNDGVAKIESRNGTDLVISCINLNDNCEMILPIVNYKGYEAKDQNGNILPIRDSDNNEIIVEIPNGFEGNINISFKQPILWIITEIISFISMIILVIVNIYVIKKNSI